MQPSRTFHFPEIAKSVALVHTLTRQEVRPVP